MSSPVRRHALLALLVGAALAVPLGAETVKVQGYAEWRDRGDLVVDGQRVRPVRDASLKLEGEARDFASVPLGYEVQAEGRRSADGAILASRVEAKPNGQALFEKQVVALTDQEEQKYRQAGQFFVDDGGRIKVIGRLHETGPQVERVRAVVDDLLPPYLDPGRVRVYVIDNPEWNAMAMGNYSVYVFSGLLDQMDDDELAIVVGHELAHATYEHTRRQFKKAMWIQIAALGVVAAAEDIDNRAERAVVQLLAQLGAMTWMNGYGRGLEDQADRVGMRYAYEAGYDITKGPRLWDRFARRYGEGNKVATFFFANHAQAKVRASNLRREMALNYPDGPRPEGPAYARRARPVKDKEPALAVAPPPFVAPPGARAAEAVPAGAAAAAPGSRARIRPGMTTEEVRRILGDPAEEVVFGGRTRWTYPDASVVFEGGRVVDVRF